MRRTIFEKDYRDMTAEIINVLIKHKVKRKEVPFIFDDCINCLDERLIDDSYPTAEEIYEASQKERDYLDK